MPSLGLTTTHCTCPGLAKCSEKVLLPLPAPHTAFCGSLFRDPGRRTDGINRLVVAVWLNHFWEALPLSFCRIYVRDAHKSLCQECQEQFALQSAVNLWVCSASGKAPQQGCLQREFPASPGLSSKPASVLLELIGMWPKPPSIYHLCGCGI